MTAAIEYVRERIEAGQYRYVLYENTMPFVSYRVYREGASGLWLIRDTGGMQAYLGRGERTLANVERRIGAHYNDAQMVRRRGKPRG